jgi:hypothetical protein
MADTQLYLKSIYDVCRQVSKEEFQPAMTGNTIYSRNEPPPEHPFSLLLEDADDEFLAHQLVYGTGSSPVLLRHAGRQKSFIAHLSKALLVHDSLTIIADGDKVIFPNNYIECTKHQMTQFHTNLSTMMFAVKKISAKSGVEWEHYLKDPLPGTRSMTIEHPHVLLTNHVSMSYFHFMMDVIPRLWIYDEWPELRKLPILIRPLGDKFEQVLADAIGVPRTQLLALPPNVLAQFHFNHLIFPSGLSDRMISERQLAFIRAKTVGAEFRPSERPWRRIFLSRKDRPYKWLDGEAEIEAALKPYGFETVLGADLTIPEQAKLFGETEMLVGVAGGGWTNMMFMPPGAVAIEMSHRTDVFDELGAQVLMEIASVGRLHHLRLTSEQDIYVLPRAEMNPSLVTPTRMIFNPDRVCAAVEAGLAILATKNQGTGAAPSPPHGVG